MSKVLFNIDDLALILVISSSLIFIKILLYKNEGQSHKLWLAAFLFCIALVSLNNILYWSPIIRLELTDYQPLLFLSLQTAMLCAPPALYIYAHSLIRADFSFSKTEFWLFSPLAIYVCCIPIIYATFDPPQTELSAINYEALYSNIVFWSFTWLQHGVKIGFGIATFRILHMHNISLENISSSNQDIGGNWLKLLVLGFLALWIMQALSQLFHEIHWTNIAQFVALFGNYFLFGLVNFLVVLSLTRAVATSKQPEATPQETAEAKEFTDEQVERLQRTMQERQPYLKSDLTLEELSKTTSIPQRTLSAIINRHHNKNFFEYVNLHRVERAAALLADDERNLTVLDIMEEAGFNSKSAFNRFFKKAKGMTPTQYKSSIKTPT